ncbi:MAG TPA: Mov34/MPN/PAD-1 family protein [Propionicimonas sp.]|jgi:integrative and conjugative element protein (TIGR02256 family)
MAQRATITLLPLAQQAITSETTSRLPMEAGGILIGHREGDGIVATDAIAVPGPTSRRNRYVRDDDRANELLRRYLAARLPGDVIGYVGEWHSHPAPSGPSSIDIESLRAIVKAAHGPIALIVYTPSGSSRYAGRIARRRRYAQPSVQDATVATRDQHSDDAPL